MRDNSSEQQQPRHEAADMRFPRHRIVTDAERLGAERVVVGFNREEATTFPDNSEDFLERATRALELSTANQVRVFSYTVSWDKREIVARLRKELPEFPFHLLWSCYLGGDRPCAQCESCQRSARAGALHALASRTARLVVGSARSLLPRLSAPERLAATGTVLKPGGEIILVSRVGAEAGLRKSLERWFQPAARKLGWRTEFAWERYSEWTARTPQVALVERRAMPPFGHFSLIRFRKGDCDNARTAAAALAG